MINRKKEERRKEGKKERRRKEGREGGREEEEREKAILELPTSELPFLRTSLERSYLQDQTGRPGAGRIW